jgi:GNAT superfamily N-acetyltransferase
MIRDFESSDAEGVSAALHEQEIPGPVTAEGVLHWHVGQPERARARSWVAVVEGRIVGWGRARLNPFTSVEGVGDVFVYVVPGYRGQGLGGALFREVEAHAGAIGARSLQTWSESGAGNAFLEARGFRATAHEQFLALDLREVDTSPLVPLEREKAAEGFALARLEDVGDRVRELHRVYAAASADVPEYFREDDVRLDEWSVETLEHPQLTRQGSFVVLADGVPVSLAFLEIDEPARLAANEMTGTLPEFRRRGLARLAKLAAIRWTAAHGFTTMLTGNAERNTGMLRLNESLGYRPVLAGTEYVREERAVDDH